MSAHSHRCLECGTDFPERIATLAAENERLLKEADESSNVLISTRLLAAEKLKEFRERAEQAEARAADLMRARNEDAAENERLRAETARRIRASRAMERAMLAVVEQAEARNRALVEALEDAQRRLDVAAEEMEYKRDPGAKAFRNWAAEARAALTEPTPPQEDGQRR